jgi:DNA-binding winged helix-turn-helix (wHTH) protein/tetratricopeptide (TPR) repeat protein
LSATQQLLRFGVFELNLDTQVLRKSGTAIKLPPQPFRLLVLLASHSGQIVTREEIQQQLWGEETYVDFEHGVNKCIKQIRTVLGDNPDHPSYIETLPRLGYRFLAPVVSKNIPAPRPQVTESESGEVVRMPLVLGRPATTAGGAAVAVAPSQPTVAPDRDAAQEPEASRPGEARRHIWRVRLLWAGAAILLGAVIGSGIYWRAHRRQVLTEKDTIVIADFDNKTGDDVFDDTLKRGLTIQLEQSPFLNVLSDRKVHATLKRMNRSGNEPLTEDLTREVCQRSNSKAMLIGSIVALGSQYVIGVRAIDCNTGDILAKVQEQATGKGAVLKALDAAALRLRRELGESLRSVQRYATPLREATTPSLEALKAFSLGLKTARSNGATAALPFIQRAIELDPNFAMAYASVSVAYNNLNEVGRAAENARRAYELRDRVSERERLHIEANYYLNATGELEKAAQTYELWQQTYPRDYVSYGDLGVVYQDLGNWDGALKKHRQAMHLEPNSGANYANLGVDYTSLNQLDDAEAVYKQAEERKLGSEYLLQSRYLLAFLKGDTTQMAQLLSTATGKPGSEHLLLALQADTQAWYGKLESAREFTRRAMDSAQHDDAKEAAATYSAAAALREVESGDRKQGIANANAAMKLAPNRDVRAMTALALSRAGDTVRADKLAAELDKTFLLDTQVQRYWLPTIRAAVALQRKKPNQAIELLTVASPIELGQPAQVTVYLCPVYLRGEAYLMLYDGNAAAAEFQKFIEHYGLVGNFPWAALARLGLARAYALQADTGRARAAYQDFLTLWKDADPDIPIYKQAKAEYAKLQ